MTVFSGILDPAGPIAAAQQKLLFDAVILMLLVVAPVFIFTALIVFRYRKSNTGAKYAPNWGSSRVLEIGVWFLPVVIVLTLATLVWSRTHALDPYRPLVSEQPPVNVQVVGLDWQWLFIYPDEGVASLNRLVIPAGRPVSFTITSDTVMNSFWIPALGGQIYAMPGMQTKLHLMADAPGNFVGRNTQYSGDGFSNQNFPADAVSAADYAAFLASAKASPTALDLAQYAEVAKPDESPEPALFSAVAPDLFMTVMSKYSTMPHGMSPAAPAGHDHPATETKP